MIIAATGHRPEKLGKEWDGAGPYSDWIRSQMKRIITNRGADELVSGMALGVDMLLAELGIEMDIAVTAAIPFEGQEKVWPKKSQDRYHRILEHPSVTANVVCDGGYEPSKMQIRNRWMVDRCHLLIAVWNGSPGGTKNCLEYATRLGKAVLHVDPEGWR